jgi:hypothetical protein
MQLTINLPIGSSKDTQQPLAMNQTDISVKDLQPLGLIQQQQIVLFTKILYYLKITIILKIDYHGCFSETLKDSSFSGDSAEGSMTVDFCAAICQLAGMSFEAPFIALMVREIFSIVDMAPTYNLVSILF